MKQPPLYEIVQFNLKVIFWSSLDGCAHFFGHITEYTGTR